MKSILNVSYMDVAHIGLVLCDSCKCKFKGFHTISSYEKKVQGSTCKSGNTNGVFEIFI